MTEGQLELQELRRKLEECEYAEDIYQNLNAGVRKKCGAEYWGLKPDQMDRAVELFHAEKAGRLVERKAIPGEGVWVVERDEDGEPYDVSGYMFLAEVSDFVILTAYIDDLDDLSSTMAYHAVETVENYDTDLAVFPAEDCYLSREEAEAALGIER